MTEFNINKPMRSGATLIGRYRYELWRIWDDELPLILFIGLNPSRANKTDDDPTIRRLIGFTKRYGYGGFYIGNLSPVINPYKFEYDNKQSTINYRYVIGMEKRAKIKVIMWGNGGSEVPSGMLDQYDEGAYCFGKTNIGHPKHPVRITYNTNLIPYNEADNLPIIKPNDFENL